MVQGLSNQQIQTTKQLPPSIQSILDASKKKDVKDVSVHLVAQAAETNYNPLEGMFSGLDADEIAVLTELSPELGAEYEKLAESKENKKHIEQDKKDAADELKKAKKAYDKAQKDLKGNLISNMFRSEEKKAELEENAAKAKEKLDFKQACYDGAEKNVISYETILERNGKKSAK